MSLEPHNYVKIIAEGSAQGEVGVITDHTPDGKGFFVQRLTGQYAKSDMKHGGVAYLPDEVEPIAPVYPELDKMTAVKGESQIIGAFLDWLINDKDRAICVEERGEYVPHYMSIEQRLAEYFEIDLELVERDRSRYLEDFTRNAGKESARAAA